MLGAQVAGATSFQVSCAKMTNPPESGPKPSSSRRSVLASAVLIGGGLTSATLMQSGRRPISRRSATLGVYGLGAQVGVANTPRFEQWLGRPIRYVVDNGDQSADWLQLVASVNWMAEQWAPTRWVPYIGVPMLPEAHRGKLSQGADGAFDAHFAEIGRNLVRQGLGRADVRIGWEMNGDWQPWAAQPDPEAWKRFYRRAVDAMRTAPDQAFRFDWCVALGDMGMDPAKAYPGDEWVDVIGGDIYCESAPWLPASARRKFADHYRNGRYGLAWHRDFAIRRNKLISFPEWGTSVGKLDSNRRGGGDDPVFIHAMARWMDGLGSRLTRHHYFLKALDRDCDLTNPVTFPRASAAFRREFGAVDPGQT